MPKSPLAHEIRRRAEAILAVKVPPSWILHKLDGSDDYGIDYYVETVGQDKRLTGRDFLVQLKGHKRGVAPSDKTVHARADTVVYWKLKLLPVLLVLVDVDFGETTPQANYAWITREQIREHKQRTMTIKVWEPFQSNEIENYLKNDYERLESWLETNRDYNLVRLMRLTVNLDSFLRVLLIWPSIVNLRGSQSEITEKRMWFLATLTWHLEFPDNWAFLENEDEFADLGLQQRKLHEMLHEATQRRNHLSAGDFWVGFPNWRYLDAHYDDLVDCVFEIKSCVRRYVSLMLWRNGVQ
jgi:hypothetical protein